MTLYILEKEVTGIFNKGAFELHWAERSALYINGPSLTVNLIIGKSKALTLDGKWADIQRRCARLFRLIQAEHSLEYFTPRTVFLNWDRLKVVASEVRPDWAAWAEETLRGRLA